MKRKIGITLATIFACIFAATWLDPLFMAESLLNPDSVKTARKLERIASLFKLTKQNDKALLVQERALEIYDRALGPNQLESAMALDHLAAIYLAKRETERWLDLRGAALARMEAGLGTHHPETLKYMSDLATTYAFDFKKKDDKAIELQLRLIAAREAALGPYHDETVESLQTLAYMYGESSDFKKKMEIQERILDIREKTEGSKSIDAAEALDDLAETYREQGDFSKAIELLKRALSIRESKEARLSPRALEARAQVEKRYATKDLGDFSFNLEHGEFSEERASALERLADAYSDAGRELEALPLRERALDIWHRNERDSNSIFADDQAWSLRRLARTYMALGKYDKAQPILEKALSLTEGKDGTSSRATAAVLGELADNYRAMDQQDGAVYLLNKALSIRETIDGPDNPANTTTIESLASTYADLEQFSLALPLQVRALAINEKTYGVDHKKSVDARYQLAQIHRGLAEYRTAQDLLKQVVETRSRLLGERHIDTAEALNSLANTYAEFDQYDEALPIQLKVLSIDESIFGANNAKTAIALVNVASTFRKLGQYEKANSLTKKALGVLEGASGPDEERIATVLDRLAVDASRSGKYPEALAFWQRSLSIHEMTFGSQHPETALALRRVAEGYVNLGQFERGLVLQQRALAISVKVLGKEHPTTAAHLTNLARIYDGMQRYDKALSTRQAALATYERFLGHEHSLTAQVLDSIASGLQRQGDSDAAVAYWKRSVNVYQTLRERVSKIGHSDLETYTQSISKTYQSLAAALTDQGRLSEAQLVLDMLKEDEQFDFVRRSAEADPRRSRVGYTPNEQKWMNRYNDISANLVALGVEERDLARLSKLPPGLDEKQRKRQTAIANDLKIAQSAFETFLDEMRKGFSDKGPARAVEIQETSAKNTRDLQSLIKSLGDDVVLAQYYVTETHVGVLLTTPVVQLARSYKVSSKDLNRQVAELRRALRDPKADPLPMSKALYKVLLGPIESDLVQVGAKTVMVSLDGTLRYIPFGALHDGKQFAASRWNMPVYTSVVRDRLRDPSTPKWHAAGLGVTRAFGDFAALPSVKSEMGSIVKAGNNTGVLPGEIYLDEAFNARRFKDVGQARFELLHIASHFRFSPGTESNSFLLLGDGQHLTLGDIRTEKYRFDNVDLLTLSACDTGLGGGRDENGKEIEGFGVIAQQQGAKAVIATLWPVADQSTARLMADMYRRKQVPGINKIEALRQAQLALLQQPKFAHPFYWAPFILMGNWK